MKKAPLDLEVAEAPANGVAYWVRADDGIRLRVASWKPNDPCNGTILFFTGRSEYIEKNGRTVEDFLRLGYAALVIDWRGQGLSDRLTKDRRMGHVERFSDYQKDVAAMIKAATDLGLPKPWYVIGNSMGASIGLRALAEGLPAAACAFTAPMWNISLTTLERCVAWPMSWAFQTFGKGEIYTPGRKGQSYVLSVQFEDNDLTNDPDMYKYYVKQAEALPETQVGSASMGWLYQSLRECRYLSNIPTPDIPCIAFLGDEDQIVDFRTIEERMAGWEGGKLELVKNGRHDLLCNSLEIRKYVTNKICELFSAADIEAPGPKN